MVNRVIQITKYLLSMAFWIDFLVQLHSLFSFCIDSYSLTSSNRLFPVLVGGIDYFSELLSRGDVVAFTVSDC